MCSAARFRGAGGVLRRSVTAEDGGLEAAHLRFGLPVT
jgi:hypothetical protein